MLGFLLIDESVDSPRVPRVSEAPLTSYPLALDSSSVVLPTSGSPETLVRVQQPGFTELKDQAAPWPRTRRVSSESEVDPLDTTSGVETQPRKRRRSSPVIHRPPPVSRATEPRRMDRASILSDISGSSILEGPSRFQWQTDPYRVDRVLVLHLMDLFFTHVNSSGYQIFPRTPFMHWLQTCQTKSQDDLMLVYTILMVAANFSTRTDRKSFSKDFGRISRYAMDDHRDAYTMQLVQSRLLFCLHSFAVNRAVEAWDVGGAAIRAATGLGLHLEGGGAQLGQTSGPQYGLNEHGSAECRRRTLWAVYLMDVSVGRFGEVSCGSN